MARKHIHLSPEAERGDEKEERRELGGGGEGREECAAIQSTKETEPIRGRCDKKCKELTSQLAAG